MAQLGILGAFLLILSHAPSRLQADANSVNKTLKQQVTRLLETMLRSVNTSDVPDPRILLALRLADQHNLAIERSMVKRLKEDAVHRVHNNMVNPKISDVIGVSPDDRHRPLTNYYQFSLGVAALCLQDANIYVNTYYLERVACSPVERMTELSVDAAALVVLYLSCKHRNADEEQKRILQNTVKCIVEKMLWKQTENATIGNIYSTGIALQALLVAEQYINMSLWNTTAIRAAVSDAISKGRFDNPLAASQITTALMGLSYLNVSDRKCSADQDNLSLDCSQPPTPNPNLRMIKVSFTAYDDLAYTFNYSIDLSVPEGSTHLNVMEIAQIYRPDEFSFSTAFSYRVFILSIDGLYSKYSDMTYHQIWNMHHLEGLDKYVVSDGEQLTARFTLG